MDGVIAKGTVEEVYSDEAGWAYGKCTPIAHTIRTMRELRARDVELYIHTARWEEDREITEWWLTEHEVPYDEISFGKPHADLYIDDKNYPKPYIPLALGLEFWSERDFEHILEHARTHSGKRR